MPIVERDTKAADFDEVAGLYLPGNSLWSAWRNKTNPVTVTYFQPVGVTYMGLAADRAANGQASMQSPCFWQRFQSVTTTPFFQCFLRQPVSALPLPGKNTALDKKFSAIFHYYVLILAKGEFIGK